MTAALRSADANRLGAVAVDYLRLFALVSMGWMWVRMATAAVREDTPFNAAKLTVAEFFAHRVLCEAAGLAKGISSGDRSLDRLDAESF